jgi:methionyl aminopeptidase
MFDEKSKPQQNVIELKTAKEIAIMREAARAVAGILATLREAVKPGVTTKYLDEMAANEISSLRMKPAFLGYRGYPATACISINEELVHGIPDKKRVLKNGDIVSIDMGVLHNGFYGDAAITVGVGSISENASKIIEVTRSALDIAIAQVKPGKRLGDVSHAVQEFVEGRGYSVVRDYVGHGIGRMLHEDPAVPNFGAAGTGPRLVPGMVICIEPMVNEGTWKVVTLKDGWTVVTADAKLCAHFEHMVAVMESGCEVLTKI